MMCVERKQELFTLESVTHYWSASLFAFATLSPTKQIRKDLPQPKVRNSTK